MLLELEEFFIFAYPASLFKSGRLFRRYAPCKSEVRGQVIRLTFEGGGWYDFPLLKIRALVGLSTVRGRPSYITAVSMPCISRASTVHQPCVCRAFRHANARHTHGIRTADARAKRTGTVADLNLGKIILVCNEMCEHFLRNRFLFFSLL
jgi:hypothetical protein